MLIPRLEDFLYSTTLGPILVTGCGGHLELGASCNALNRHKTLSAALGAVNLSDESQRGLGETVYYIILYSTTLGPILVVPTVPVVVDGEDILTDPHPITTRSDVEDILIPTTQHTTTNTTHDDQHNTRRPPTHDHQHTFLYL
jgi:hypothetical protein